MQEIIIVVLSGLNANSQSIVNCILQSITMNVISGNIWPRFIFSASRDGTFYLILNNSHLTLVPSFFRVLREVTGFNALV